MQEQSAFWDLITLYREVTKGKVSILLNPSMA